ncbi:MAG TPA: universal stress protein [Nitrospinota bacterium]|nr:universal stress protein [Nitrospinota bacterium]|tara:strand:+ start:46817 stop:47233 length:417 start_codon:yes stop_codon:yes gene_type:complete
MGETKQVIMDSTILIVGHEDSFSPKLIEYAISMANRMQCGIAALNVVPIGSRLTSLLDSKLKESIVTEAKKQATNFEDAAQKRGISFKHIIKFGDVDKSIRDVHSEIDRIHFIIAEPDYVPGNKDIETAFPVFTVKHD